MPDRDTDEELWVSRSSLSVFFVGVPVFAFGSLQPSLALTTADYLQIADWTGRQLVPGKRGRITGDTPAILEVIDTDAKRWAARVGAFGSGWHRAAGSAQDLIALAERLGQRWMKGLRLAMTLG